MIIEWIADHCVNFEVQEWMMCLSSFKDNWRVKKREYNCDKILKAKLKRNVLSPLNLSGKIRETFREKIDEAKKWEK